MKKYLIYRISYLLMVIVLMSCQNLRNKEQFNDTENILDLNDRNIVSKEKQKNYSGKFKTYYINRKLKEVCNYKNGLIEGLYLAFYPNGNIRYITNFKNNFYDGNLYHYYENGQIESIIHFEDGIANGLKIKYFNNGKIKSIFNFKNGYKFGSNYKYYQNGVLESYSELEFDTVLYERVYDSNTSAIKKIYRRYKVNYSSTELNLKDTIKANVKIFGPLYRNEKVYIIISICKKELFTSHDDYYAELYKCMNRETIKKGLKSEITIGKVNAQIISNELTGHYFYIPKSLGNYILLGYAIVFNKYTLDAYEYEFYENFTVR